MAYSEVRIKSLIRKGRRQTAEQQDCVVAFSSPLCSSLPPIPVFSFYMLVARGLSLIVSLVLPQTSLIADGFIYVKFEVSGSLIRCPKQVPEVLSSPALRSHYSQEFASSSFKP